MVRAQVGRDGLPPASQLHAERFRARGIEHRPRGAYRVGREISRPDPVDRDVRVAGLVERLAREVVWGKVEFISDPPGKNETRRGLGGGGASAVALGKLVEGARERVVIQSPYLVVSERALGLLHQARARGVRVRISTNSLASTDNIQAFSGYRNQRGRLLEMGLQIHEYKPDPLVQRELMQRTPGAKGKVPVFSLHAKTMVVDGSIVYIGTFNFDPRSENLNTEVGVIIENRALARTVEAAIETDMAPANSWNAATDRPDEQVSLLKRARTRFWQFMPIKPLL